MLLYMYCINSLPPCLSVCVVLYHFSFLGQWVTSRSDALQHYNSAKNRYQDRLPCEHTLIIHMLSWNQCMLVHSLVYKQGHKINTHKIYTVIFFLSSVNTNRARLRPTGTPGADYINASFVDVRTMSTILTITLILYIAWCHFNQSLHISCRVIRSVMRTSLPRLLCQTLSVTSGEWFGSSRANASSCCATWLREEWWETLTH